MHTLRSLASYYRHNVLISNRHKYPHASSLRIAAFHWEKQHCKPQMNREMKSNSTKPSLPPVFFYSWAKWILGSMLAVAWPFWNKPWKGLLKIEDEVEIVADAVETTAEIVEKVATVAEKLSLDIAEKLPEEGRLKNAALFVERLAKEAAEESHLAQDIIHKMDELKEEMESLINPRGRKVHPDTDEGHSRKHAE